MNKHRARARHAAPVKAAEDSRRAGSPLCTRHGQGAKSLRTPERPRGFSSGCPCGVEAHGVNGGRTPCATGRGHAPPSKLAGRVRGAPRRCLWTPWLLILGRQGQGARAARERDPGACRVAAFGARLRGYQQKSRRPRRPLQVSVCLSSAS